ncbi:MAG: hypothetical protein ACK4OO_05155 [bacterium]
MNTHPEGLLDHYYQELSGLLLQNTSLSPSDEDVAIINALNNPPPVPVTARDIYVRRCRLAGDGIDSGFGRFRTEDLPLLLHLVQGAPALIGHRKEGLGVARFFGGEIAPDPRTGITYIIPKFYWMRAHSRSEDLRVNIDGGLWCEASLGFLFRQATCSLCGEEIRKCPHIPGKEYPQGLCYFYYDQIIKVTEGSFVYRGAQPGTGFMLNDTPFSPLNLETLPRFRLHGVWYRGFPEKWLPL